jgi:Protein of unknown function (DUF1403)
MVRTPLRTLQRPAAETLSLPPLPGWARLDTSVTDGNDAGFRAGAALASLDMRVRADARAVSFDGVWRRRLALRQRAPHGPLSVALRCRNSRQDFSALRRGEQRAE